MPSRSWQVRCAAHLIADHPEVGETPEPPPEVAAVAASGSEGQSHPAKLLSEGVFTVLRLQLQAICAYEVSPATSPLCAALSPALGTALLHFLRRFACCYLMPDEATCSIISPALLALWGSDTQGANDLLSLCVDAAAVYLLRWPSEADAAHEACALLASLGRLRAPRRGPAQLLCSLPSWQRLATVNPASLPPKAQRLLMEALSRAAAAVADEAAREASLRSLIAPMPARLQGIAARVDAQNPKALLLRPDVALEVRACCASLRGIALSCGRSTVATTVEGLGPCLQLLLQMIPSYSPVAEPLLAILKVHRDLACAAAPLLPPPAAQALAEHATELVCLYALHASEPAMAASADNVGKLSDKDLEDHLRYKQLKSVLQLLAYIAGRDEDQAHPSEGAYTQALCAAISHVLPSVTETMLAYPKLTAAYFALLSTWLENRPLAAVSMPAALYDPVFASLSFGLSHHDANICRGALETAYELARRASQHGNSAATMDHLLRQLLNRVTVDLLTHRLHPDVVDPAGGNTLLALIVAQQSHWQGLVSSLIEAQPSIHAKERVNSLFSALLSSNGVSTSLSRPNRIKFRANLEVMLRGITAADLILPSS